LANALQTSVEAKVQALAAAKVKALNGEGFATGTATDSICIACLPGTQPYAGAATRHGGDLAAAVYEAVLHGAMASRLVTPPRSVSPPPARKAP
jgi:adenosylcobinamide amidohydrolase